MIKIAPKPQAKIKTKLTTLKTRMQHAQPKPVKAKETECQFKDYEEFGFFMVGGKYVPVVFPR